ncbi:MAG TPA: DUF190 domain-containing protein [Bryobacteraceae bacterium]|nr:DUF190 domain-containing protein [Bryobacteraceae bacterium]
MQIPQPAKLLRIHLSESDRYQGRPLSEAIVAKCRELEISGATVFQGLEGFGETAELHRAHLIRHDQPVVIVIVDTAEKIAHLVSAIEPMLETGLMSVSDVEMIRVTNPGAPPSAAPPTNPLS